MGLAFPLGLNWSVHHPWPWDRVCQIPQLLAGDLEAVLSGRDVPWTTSVCDGSIYRPAPVIVALRTRQVSVDHCHGSQRSPIGPTPAVP